MHRSYSQLRLYHGYIKQLRAAGEIKVDIGQKVWRGRLNAVKSARYILKVLDLELPHTNPNFPTVSKNKIKFDNANMEDLTHHISFLKEVLLDNKITPFNEPEYQ